MKPPYFLAYLTAFMAAALPGFWVGSGVSQAYMEPAQVELPAAAPEIVPAQPLQQRSLLVITVTALDEPGARLESLWMVTYRLYSPPVLVIPLFPAYQGSQIAYNLRLDRAFDLIPSANGFQLAPAFLEELHRQKLAWDGLLVLDRAGSAAVAQVFGSAQVSDNPLILLEDLCWGASQLSIPPDFVTLASLAAGHVYSDLDTRQLLIEWQALTSNITGPFCELPSLNGASR